MNQFQRKSLYAALAGVGALGMTTAADAVNVNPNGLGQVLIYPYYTVNSDANGNAYNSLLSVVNSTASAKAVKVRFLEGKNSREVLDFNLFLSKHDVWTAAVVPNASSGGGAVVSFDKSCTIPDNSNFAPPGAQFVNFAYTGSSDDKGGSGLDRTKEGYVEIIEMATFPTYSCTSIQVTHVGGVPFDCAHLSDGGAASDARSATGGLFGGMSLINVNAGTDYTEDAVALDSFVAGVRDLYFPAGDIHPQLQDVFPKISVVIAPQFSFDLGVYTTFWTNQTLPGAAADPVSAVLMHDQVMNEYVLDPGTKSGTDWVLTFPTKRFYVNVGTGSAPRLFQRNFNDGSGACDDITLAIYDREEKTTSTPVTFSPPPPTPTTSICWEANVITFNNSNVLASKNISNINTGNANGWLNLGFAQSTTTTSTFHTLGSATGASAHVSAPSFFSTGLTKTYLGLPVVGFAVQSFSNGTLVVGGSNELSNYGGNFVHKTTTTIFN
jgi:hypothetical protein